MISSPPSLATFTSRTSAGKPLCSDIENENSASPPLSPKRSFTQDDDRLSQLESKRRHVHAETQASRRAPLDPLSASNLENRRSQDPRWTTSLTHHSLVTSSSVPDLRSFRLGQPVGSGSWEQQCSATTGTPVTGTSICSWPPPTSTSDSGSSFHSSHSGRQGGDILYSSDAKKPSRASSTGPTSTWPPPGSSQIQTTTTMLKPTSTRTHGWKSENVLQPIRSRTNSMPHVRCPPEDLWRSNSSVSPCSTPLEPRSGSEPVRTVYGLVNDGDSLPYSTSPLTPPGLRPYRPELRRSGCDSNLLACGSASLSLASGSQPLRGPEQAKFVAPIGAERSRVVSMIPLKPQPQKPKPTPTQTTDPNDPSRYLWHPPLLSPRLQAKWKSLVSSSEGKSAGKPAEAPEVTGCSKVSREDFERLLRQATKNQYATKIISPLSPLRTPAPAFSLTADSAYQLRMPSLFNKPSPRYSKGPERRLRRLCDSYQPHDLDSTCVHCQECKRDTIGKRLLVFRYHQQQSHSQRTQLHPFPSYDTTKLVRSYHGQGMVIEGDEDEKSLWDEVAAVTSTAPLPFPRTGSRCAVAAATHLRGPPASPRLKDLRGFDKGGNDGGDDAYPDILDEDLLTNESVALFREVSVY
ncbi:hypothetical protein BS17DRAFT_781360 [Gyrodon lividus]|nr:hypothetical protein BS17DRAFT_781360 [Gyrodon lividus]